MYGSTTYLCLKILILLSMTSLYSSSLLNETFMVPVNLSDFINKSTSQLGYCPVISLCLHWIDQSKQCLLNMLYYSCFWWFTSGKEMQAKRVSHSVISSRTTSSGVLNVLFFRELKFHLGMLDWSSDGGGRYGKNVSIHLSVSTKCHSPYWPHTCTTIHILML